MTFEINSQLIDLAEAGRIARLSWAGINYHAKVGHLPTQKVFKNAWSTSKTWPRSSNGKRLGNTDAGSESPDANEACKERLAEKAYASIET